MAESLILAMTLYKISKQVNKPNAPLSLSQKNVYLNIRAIKKSSVPHVCFKERKGNQKIWPEPGKGT